MNPRSPRPASALLALAALLPSSPALPTTPPAGPMALPQAHGTPHATLVVPSARSFVPAGAEGVRTERVHARIELLGGVARTTLDVHLENPGHRPAEASVLLPVPRDAAVVGLDFEGGALEPTAELLPVEEATATYRGIVQRLADPALLEFAGTALVRTSVFPVPARGRQTLRVVLEQTLGGGGQEYLLPRSEHAGEVVPWTLEVLVPAGGGYVYSPSHALERLPDPARLHLRSVPGATRQPGPVRLVHLHGGEGPLCGTVLAHPDLEGGGHFLFLAAPLAGDAELPHVPRSVTLVLDRSGSMAGEKLVQASAAVLRIVEGLAPGETFNLIDYASQVARFALRPVPATEPNRRALAGYLAGLRAGGGTNLHDALALGLESGLAEGGTHRLPVVLLLTDGVATVGETAEARLRALPRLLAGDGPLPRLFPVGIGHDVQAPLLDALALETRGVSSYVLPGEDVGLEMDRLFARLRGPVWTDLCLEVRTADGAADPRLLRDVHPAPLPDLFEGDALVLSGRYLREEPLELVLHARGPAGPASFRFPLDLRRAPRGRASLVHGFVPRLWAVREIASLVDALRAGGGLLGEVARRELIEEIVRLSTRHGVLSEYTAFLATEGTDLGAWEGLVRGAAHGLAGASAERSGEWAVNQSRSLNEQKLRQTLDYRNGYWDSAGRRRETTAVQQLADGAFLRRGERWIDSRLVLSGELSSAPAERLSPGQEAHARLLEELARQGRAGWLSLPGEVLVKHGERVLLVDNTPR